MAAAQARWNVVMPSSLPHTPRGYKYRVWQAAPMHTFVRLRGFGLSVVPFAPYAVRRIDGAVEGAIAI